MLRFGKKVSRKHTPRGWLESSALSGGTSAFLSLSKSPEPGGQGGQGGLQGRGAGEGDEAVGEGGGRAPAAARLRAAR